MQAFIDFILNHQAVLGAIAIAVLDLAFALSPGLQGNGILHSIYVFFQNLVKPKA